MAMTNLTLTADQPCNWHEITTILQGLNPSTRQITSSNECDSQFSCTLPTTPQEMTTTLFELKHILGSLDISFSLEISP